MIYAVLDTNIVVSALVKPLSIPGSVLRSVYYGNLIPLLHIEIVEEYKNVLERPKFGFAKQVIDGTLNAIEASGKYVSPKQSNEMFPDEKDRIFYEIALAEYKNSKAYLITGNIRHFPVKDFVVSPREIVALLDENLPTEM